MKIGDQVKIGKASYVHTVLKVNTERQSALIDHGVDWLWWPIKDLTVIGAAGQSSMFDDLDAEQKAIDIKAAIENRIKIMQEGC